ncbi:MAG: biotin/lipoyl-binding protein [Anaerolineae bacterium]|jgi:biotin carboxyl carrier protein|nr:biotin/lipoyl-binding protein [Anaerolineae bacterium]
MIFTFTYQHQDHTYTVQLEPLADGSYQALIGDRNYRFHATDLAGQGWVITLDHGERVVAYTAQAAQARFVQVTGETAQALTVPDQRRARRRGTEAGGATQLFAQMPGQVVDVLVQPGDTVQSGQTLLVLEAMKMEIRLSAQTQGIIKQILVKKGDVVEREQLLIEIDTQI